MKLFYTILIAFVLSPAAIAQKITENDLNGKWKIVGISKEGARVDFETGKVTVTEEWKKNNPDKTVAEMEEKLKGGELGMLSAIAFVFKDGMMSVEMGGQSMQESPITLVEENGKMYMADGVMGGGRTALNMKDGRLLLDMSDKQMVMELKKSE
jgi:hypothetical protein